MSRRFLPLMLLLVLGGAMAWPTLQAAGPQSPAPASQPGAAPTTATATTARAPIVGDPVPDELIEQIQAQMVQPDDKLADSAKLRRYRSILRYGKQAENDYPHAANLYVVRGLMLQAGKCLAELGEGDMTPDQAIALARGIVEAPAAPASARIAADLLLTQAALMQIGPDKARALKEIQEFLARYEDSDVYYNALMHAILFVRPLQEPRLLDSLAERLERDYLDEPGVAAFLKQQLNRISFRGRSFVATLRRLDGSTLQMPRDLLGKVVLVHFWTASSDRSTRMLKDMAKLHKAYRDKSFEIVSISLDRNRPEVEKVIRDNGLEWIQTYSGKGPEDPIVEYYGVKNVPAFWLIGPDGRVIQDLTSPHRTRWEDSADIIALSVERAWRKRWTFMATRIGLLLADTLMPSLPAATQPAAADPLVGRVREQVLSILVEPAPDGRAARAKGALETFDKGPLPQGAALSLARVYAIIAARCLAIEQGDSAAGARALEISRALLADETDPQHRLLAEYVVLGADLSSGDLANRDLSARIREYVARYRQTPLEWAATVQGMALSMELAQDTTLRDLSRDCERRWRNQSGCRAFMRSLMSWSIEPDDPLGPMELPLLAGGTLKWPGDLAGKTVVLHFWSAAAVPQSRQVNAMRLPTLSAYAAAAPSAKLAVVAVNLDRDRELARAEAAKLPAGWIHVFSGQGIDDPLARRLCPWPLPSSWLFARDATLLLTDASPDMMDLLQQAGHDLSVIARDRHRAADTVHRRWPTYNRARQAYAAAWAMNPGWKMQEERWEHYQSSAERMAAGMHVLRDEVVRQKTALLENADIIASGAPPGDRGPKPQEKLAAALAAIGQARAQMLLILQLDHEEYLLRNPITAEMKQYPATCDTLSFAADEKGQKRAAVLQTILGEAAAAVRDGQYAVKLPAN